jgi:choline-sulfatase
MSDQHSRHVLSCYGNGIVRTPNLDRLAQEGMRFTDAYCPAPLCVPSRMGFMTARTPSRNRVWTNKNILNSETPTWAHLMRLAGYDTALIGRMHFEGPDQRHGFDERPIGERSAGPPGMKLRGGPMHTRFPNSTHGQTRPSVEIAGKGRTLRQWADEARMQAAVDWIEARGRNPGPRPFAAVAGFVLPHCPFVAPEPLFDYYYDRIDIPPIEENQPPSTRRFRERCGILQPPLEAERIRVARAAYFGLCEHVDSLIGRVLDALDRTGLGEDTLVVYTSDHGEMAGEHGCWWKSTYYEGSAGVPLIARWPGVVSAGSTQSAVCNLMDIGPTFAEIAGTGFPYPVQGRSLHRLLTRQADPDWPEETFSEFVERRGMIPSRMIRSGPWKLWTEGGPEGSPPVLLNLRDDPDELIDLADDPAHADVRSQLLEKLHADWAPETVRRECLEREEHYDLLVAHTRATDAQSPDNIEYPPAEYESGVQLL